MHDVVAFRREWFVAAAMRAIRDPPSVGVRSIIARATALDNMRRVVEGCARVAVWLTTSSFRFAFLDLDLDFNATDRLARVARGDRRRAHGRRYERRATYSDAFCIRVAVSMASRETTNGDAESKPTLALNDASTSYCVDAAKKAPSGRVRRRRTIFRKGAVTGERGEGAVGGSSGGDSTDEEEEREDELEGETTTTRWKPWIMWRVDVLIVMLDWLVTLVCVAFRARWCAGRLTARAVVEETRKRLDARAAEGDEDVDDGVLITGWSSGLGRASAMELAKAGFAVVVPYRLGGLDSAHAFARDCRKGAPYARIEFIGPLDLESERDVRGIDLSRLRARGIVLRTVVHCAAVFSVLDIDARADEETDPSAIVNYRNIVLLTETLQEKLKNESHPVRFVFIGSFVHRCATAKVLGYDWLKCWHEAAGAARAYCNPALGYMWSKVCVSVYACVQHKLWTQGDSKKFSAVLVDPGMVDTRLTRAWPFALQALFRFGGKALGLMQSPTQAARGVVQAVCMDAEREICPNIYGPVGVDLGLSYWMRDEKARALISRVKMSSKLRM